MVHITIRLTALVPIMFFPSGLALHPPGRPEELHLQSPADPYVNLAIHTARASPFLAVSPPQGDAESEVLLPVSWLALFPLCWLIPFAPSSLQGVHRYYGMIRPLRVPRYFPLSWTPLIGFSLPITRRV